MLLSDLNALPDLSVIFLSFFELLPRFAQLLLQFSNLVPEAGDFGFQFLLLLRDVFRLFQMLFPFYRLRVDLVAVALRDFLPFFAHFCVKFNFAVVVSADGLLWIRQFYSGGFERFVLSQTRKAVLILIVPASSDVGMRRCLVAMDCDRQQLQVVSVFSAPFQHLVAVLDHGFFKFGIVGMIVPVSDLDDHFLRLRLFSSYQILDGLAALRVSLGAVPFVDPFLRGAVSLLVEFSVDILEQHAGILLAVPVPNIILT